MNSIIVAAVVFACAFGGTIFGMILRARLPEAHVSAESKDAIRIASGLLATLSALVLGLLVASAKSSFDSQESGFQQLSANIIVLDRLLELSGMDTDAARDALRRAVVVSIDRLWPNPGTPAASLDTLAIAADGNALYTAIRDLKPTNDAQRSVQTQAMHITTDLARTRWLMGEPQDSGSSTPFLIVLLFWLFALYASFGLFAPRNGAVMAAFLVCALSAAGAVFLIVDLNDPSAGLIKVSSSPMRFALAQLGK